MRSSDEHEVSLGIKQDEKFFTRILSKETSMANSSCRVYYGNATGSIPFKWESRPGTPKHTFSDTTLPPLTPPPSYHTTSKSNSVRNSNVKPNLFTTVFHKLIMTTKRSTHISPSSSMSSTTSTSSSWSSSSYSCHESASKGSRFRKRRFSGSRSLVCYRDYDDDEDYDSNENGIGSPTSILRYDDVEREGVNGFQGCHLMGKMKNAFLSIVRHGLSG